MSYHLWSQKSLLYLRLTLDFLPLKLFIWLALFLRPQPSPSAAQYLTIPGSNGTGQLGLYLHSPPPIEGAANPTPKPVHISFHGGGFTCPLYGFDARFCFLVAKDAGCYVVDAEYRLAPDYPFPAGYDDATRVLQWIALGGFSAGGNLALALAETVQEPVKGVVAFYPPVDATLPYRFKSPPPAMALPAGRARCSL
ncbi:alpha/beta-hydrolase [Calocera cornea HHB12733]|uniref:Alpha/beta-hydrolase n=1 Tax=Calocera cornea HHB12733 TaxID=1353952 RepID=A0A165DMK5_9BASI|nr:alpha/beta-hydrolase [Calocera cornea HHB12733]